MCLALHTTSPSRASLAQSFLVGTLLQKFSCSVQVGQFVEFACRLPFESTPRKHVIDVNMTADEPAASGHGSTEECSVTATDRHVILFGGVVRHTNLYSNTLYILEKATMIWTRQVCHSRLIFTTYCSDTGIQQCQANQLELSIILKLKPLSKFYKAVKSPMQILVLCRHTKAMCLQPVPGMLLCGMLQVSVCFSLAGQTHIDA